MANRIKGITVQIGGDTTKLDKALSGVNQIGPHPAVSHVIDVAQDPKGPLQVLPGVMSDVIRQRLQLLGRR